MELAEPFLTTREMLLLHYVPDLGDRFLATAPADRADFLAAEVDPLSNGEIGRGLTGQPRYVEEIEWFATSGDVCRAFAELLGRSDAPALAPLDAILTPEQRGLDLARSDWPTLWYKGGSEPGVLTLGWLATDAGGRSFVVHLAMTDPDAPLPEDSIDRGVAIAEDAFALLAAGEG